MATGSSRFTHISLGSLEEKINLNPRQLELLKQRRARLDGQVEKKILPAQPSLFKNHPFLATNKEVGLGIMATVPQTFSRSSASNASTTADGSSHTLVNPRTSFYGQALPKQQRKKMYDDMGASYYESSSSEASAPSAISSDSKLKPSATDLTEALTKSSSYESGAPSELSSMKESANGNGNQADMKAQLKKRLLANMAEKRKRSSTTSPALEKRRQSFGLKGPKNKGGLPDDQQRAFLRNLMQSAYNKPRQEEEPPKEVPEAESRSSVVSARSATTFSSATSAEDKAIMRKVVERNRKKRTSNEKPKKTFFRSALNKDIKAPSPTSGTSDETANDERSGESGPRRLFGRNKKVRSPQNTVSRWTSNSGSIVEKESSESEGVSYTSLGIRNQKTMLTRDHTGSTYLEKVLSIETPSSVDVRPQMTEVSALSRKSSTELDAGPSFHSHGLFQGMPLEDDATCGRCSIASRSSMIHGKGMQAEVAEAKHARAVLESLMEPVDLTSPTLHSVRSFKSPLPSKSGPPKTQEDSEKLGTLEEEDPEGYAEFVSTLKAEVANSHSLLWESFNGLFREEIHPLSSEKGGGHFDDNMKAIVAKMSNHLKTNYQIACVSGTEIANDKMVRIKPNVKKPKFAQHAIETTFEFEADKENGVIMQVPSTDSINEDPENNVIEVTLGQFVRKSMGGISCAPGVRTKAPLKTASSTKSLKSVLKPTSFTPKSNTDSSIPWSGVKLRSLHETNKSEVTSTSIPLSWAKVKLRPVSAKNETSKTFDCVDNADTSPANADDSSDFRRIVVSKKKEGMENKAKTPKTLQGPEVIEIIDLADISSTAGFPIDLTTNGNPIDLTDKSNEDLPIDLTAAETPRTVASLADTRATGITADGSVLVSLAPEPNSEPVKVLIGKRGIVKIRTKPGETKARVVWRHELEDIRSAILDLASSKVKLLLHSSNDHKDLAFASPDACMRFANSLHEQTHKARDDDDTEVISVDESLYVEHLNEEEQRVLEEFRQSKKQDPPATLDQIQTSFEKPMSVINTDAIRLNSPMSEISGPGAALSSAELVNAQSYMKMIKLHVPKEAVRHKMERDGACSKVVDFVLGTETPEDTGIDESDSGLTATEEAIASGYRKMLKMRIPLEAVRHKMEKEGVDCKIVASVLGRDPPTPDPVELLLPKSEPSVLSIADEAVAAPFRKMLKMMIPKEAVEHKMTMEKVDPKIIAAVVGTTAKSENAALSRPGIPSLTDEEEAVASSYRKMMSLRIPKEAVRQKMVSEGISKKIISSVLQEKMTIGKDKGQSKRAKQGFHWKALESSENLQNSVWSKASFDSSLLEDDITISSHVEQFQKKTEADEASHTINKSKSDLQKEKAKLIDLGRANNIAITLKAFGEFSQEELAQVIEFVDPFEKIKGDRALFMKDLLPASAEIKVIKSYTGDESRLVPAERWFKKIVDIQRIDEKIHVIRTMESFRNEAIALGETFQQLTNVCNQVMGSDKLPDLLEMVRQIGNRMNNDSGEGAAGFKLDFLPRLAQTKGSDKKTTALDLVVMIFHTRNRREALLLNEDFPGCYEASRLQIRELIADVKMLGGAIQKCKKELDILINENGVLPPRRKVFIGDSHSDSGVTEPTKGIGGDSVKTNISSMHEELFARRSKLINSALDKGEVSKPATSPRAAFLAAIANPEEKSYTYQGAVNRINRFIDEAKLIFAELEARRDQALTACHELTEFFCEAGGEQNAPPLLAILAEFAGNLNKALTKYDNQKMAEARRKANTEKKPKEILENGVKREENYRKTVQTEKKSLVLMVNEMLKIAGDKQREDFINGVVYDNPDSRLQQIYEAEKKLGKSVGSPGSRKNILRTIEERRNADDSRVALSELAMAMQKRSLSIDSQSPTAQSAAASYESPTASDFSEAGKYDFCTRKQLSITDRWTRKYEDETVTNELIFDPSNDKGIDASDSHDSDDRKFEEKKRQQYMGRWTSQNDILEATGDGDDLENESDIGALLDYHNRSRQDYVNRWQSKPDDREKEVESLSMSP